jgi:hypothetical protein
MHVENFLSPAHVCTYIHVYTHPRHVRTHTRARAQAAPCIAIPVILYTGKKKKRYINISKRKTKVPNYLCEAKLSINILDGDGRPSAPRVCACMCMRIRVCTCVCMRVRVRMQVYRHMQVHRQRCGRTHPPTTQRSSLFYFRSNRGEGSTLPPNAPGGAPPLSVLGPSLLPPSNLVDHGESDSSSRGISRARGDPDQTRSHARTHYA